MTVVEDCGTSGRGRGGTVTKNPTVTVVQGPGGTEGTTGSPYNSAELSPGSRYPGSNVEVEGN